MQPPLEILHLEDNPLDGAIVARLLQTAGLSAHISRVQTLAELRQGLKNPAVALVLSDYTIPGVDTLEALKLTRSKRPDIAYVFISGTIGEELAINTLKMGATDYVLKEHMEDLPRAVRRAMAVREQYRQRENVERELLETKERLARANLELEQTVRSRTAALEAANRELQEFVYTVSHDLRAPLRHIISFATILKEENTRQLDDSGKEYVNIITEAGTRMEELLEGLLSFSRLNQTPLQFVEVNLRELVDDARRELAPSLKNRNIEWVVADMPSVQGDPRLLRSAISNLVSNAVKYSTMRDPARIEIKSYSQGDEVIFSIADNGAGFDMAGAPKLFKVFQRLHSPSEFPGTGIGLASVRRIIQRHGGRTWAEGTPGKGATFYFSLPARATQPLS